MELYEAIGGMPGCRRLAESFYRRVPRDPVLAPFFPGKSQRCAIDAFTLFLAQFLGGPSEYSEHRWYITLRDAHARFPIGVQERDAWLRNMAATLQEREMPAELRDGLQAFFEQSGNWLAGQPEGGACPHREIEERWQLQRSLEQAVEALRRGDTGQAVALAESGRLDKASLASLLALMPDSDYYRERLRLDPQLAAQRHRRGRTLLHDAAAGGNIAAVTLLLELGADANAADGGGHPPVYALANECHSEKGPAIAALLVGAGADPGSGLHMAARRGNVALAAALLDLGAPLEATDRSGDTALRRAVNCRKTHVAALLRARGARL